MKGKGKSLPVLLLEGSTDRAGAETLSIGGRAPEFKELLGADGRRYSLSSFEDEAALVVIFSSNGCPTARAFEDRVIALQEAYADRDVQVVAINSNNASLSPPDTYPEMVKRAKEKGFNFPYLKDGDRSVAKAYRAICTFHLFVLDRERRLRYRGRFDDSRDPAKVTSHDLANALEDVLADRAVRIPVTQPYGCAIVW